ncbi:MAG: preprotein translocase subunit SecY [Clostridiales bacterium]|nr:preprotein translocase subunit SecY [Clostridiales bacterium]
MLEIFRNAWKVAELRKKIIYTLIILFIYRIGSFIPVPGVVPEVFQGAISDSPVWSLLDVFNGGALGNFTIFATGITPYITASIVMTLLAVAIPALERLQKQGAEGKKKISQITRYVGLGLAFTQSMAIMLNLGAGALSNPAWYMYLFIAVVHMAGTAFAMWLGEHITEKGIGNGISLLIFVNIISRFPLDIQSGIKAVIDGNASGWSIPLVMIGLLVIIASVVLINLGERRIPVQYAKKVVGRKMYGGQSTYIPMRVNNSGVLPLIFASTIIMFPGMLMNMFFAEKVWAQKFMVAMSPGSLVYAIVMALFILAFAYFYSTIQFNPIEVSKNIQQYGGFVPGIRPGKPTSIYLSKVSNRITLFSALFLAMLAMIPMILTANTGSSSPIQATSILIMVSVGLETAKQLESQMMMRHYKGFLN